ncbi:MAG: endonuclease/exonuclease/phosphatase [bacterium]|nr:endonuclease/exonuclease/phosphatase [bacterium]
MTARPEVTDGIPFDEGETNKSGATAMAAAEFTASEWSKIRKTLDKDPIGFGLPERVYGSLVVASFNIRKLGKLQTGSSGSDGRDDRTMRFLADVCQHFDVIAVQEVMNDMTGIRRLRELLGDEYGLIVSDVVGRFPGERGNEERLAYLYNRRVVRRGDMVAEVSTSRTRVLKTLAEYHGEFFEVMESDPTAKKWREFTDKVAAAIAEDKRPPRRLPSFQAEVDRFVQFIRAPFAASFVVRAQAGAEQFEFLAVNAHLHFGREVDRQNEAAALIEWILGKVRSDDAENVLLLGDLNFNFDNPRLDLGRIQKRFEQLGGFDTDGGRQVFVSFPFIVGHPRPKQNHTPNELFRTNIRLTQTYDQIGLFSRDSRLRRYIETTPDAAHRTEHAWGALATGPDYGVFNFTDLFCQALEGVPYSEMGRTERAELVKRYEHNVSDHMPIWFRAPLPMAEQGFPTGT